MTLDQFADRLDLAQLCVDAFLLGFLIFVLYLRREDKREGYPLERARPEGGRDEIGFPKPPPPKFLPTMHDGTVRMPHDTLHGAEFDDPVASTLPFIAATPAWSTRSRFIGVPLEPDGDPLLDGVGPAAFSARDDTPLRLRDCTPQVVPLRRAAGWSATRGHPDPRGMQVVAADHVVVGEVVELWVDRGVRILRYLEVAALHGGRRMLLPIYFAEIRTRRRQVHVTALRSAQFEGLPMLRDPHSITAREEDRINAYYASGTLYAWRSPKEPVR